jgi:hypothetical protein
MYILAWLAMLCGFLGVLCGLGSFALHPGRGRRIGLVSSASLIVVGLGHHLWTRLRTAAGLRGLGRGLERTGIVVLQRVGREWALQDKRAEGVTPCPLLARAE